MPKSTPLLTETIFSSGHFSCLFQRVQSYKCKYFSLFRQKNIAASLECNANAS
jgi:hypothetical protein